MFYLFRCEKLKKNVFRSGSLILDFARSILLGPKIFDIYRKAIRNQSTESYKIKHIWTFAHIGAIFFIKKQNGTQD